VEKPAMEENNRPNNQDPPNKNQAEKSHKATEADPETLHTTDPQEHMKGPISNWMQHWKKSAENNDNQPKEAEKHDHKSNATGGDFINK
jgi:hypothetical protein